MTKSIGFIPQQTQTEDYEIYTGKHVTLKTSSAKLNGLVEKVSNGIILLKLEENPEIISSGANTAIIKTRDIDVIAPSIFLYGPDNKPIYSNK